MEGSWYDFSLLKSCLVFFYPFHLFNSVQISVQELRSSDFGERLIKEDFAGIRLAVIERKKVPFIILGQKYWINEH